MKMVNGGTRSYRLPGSSPATDAVMQVLTDAPQDYQTIETKSGYARKTVRNAMNYLEEAGLVLRVDKNHHRPYFVKAQQDMAL
jgi:predicted transcriptional regulator